MSGAPIREPASLQEHPAVRAWCEVATRGSVPDQIEILKQKTNSKVYRLTGVGPDGSAVIAKWHRRELLLAERVIYEQVLPRFPLPALRCYGLTDGGSRGHCWLFLEDAGEVECSPDSEHHRSLAASWLGRMHASSARIGIAVSLPQGGPPRYLDYLRSARIEIRRSLGNPAPLPELFGRARVLARLGYGETQAATTNRQVVSLHGSHLLGQ